MSTLARYRVLVPGHAAVDDSTVETWLEIAARRHLASAFGLMYAEAMIWWAAHRIERTPGLVSSSGGAGEVGPVVSQTDGDLSRTYAQPAQSAVGSTDAELGTTRYGQAYLDLRNTRAAGGPTYVLP
jgi:hypothetical protein